jgi:hypothetical protein
MQAAQTLFALRSVSSFCLQSAKLGQHGAH